MHQDYFDVPLVPVYMDCDSAAKVCFNNANSAHVTNLISCAF